jgi:hypothetical protein
MLRKWSQKSAHFGDEIILASAHLRGKPASYWGSVFFVTALSWTSRFLIVNALIAAFSIFSFLDQGLILGRQLIMWVILLISPTPGGSGIAEFFFPIFFNDFIPSGMALTIALLWRLMTYYPYLFMGLIVFPFWRKRIFGQKNSKK